jgi:hypothetical protein
MASKTMTGKAMTLMINPEEIMHTSISKSADGYNYASAVAKKGEGEYISINYEWKGTTIPDFAFDLMGFIQSNKESIDKAVASYKEEYEELTKNK